MQKAGIPHIPWGIPAFLILLFVCSFIQVDQFEVVIFFLRLTGRSRFPDRRLLILASGAVGAVVSGGRLFSGRGLAACRGRHPNRGFVLKIV